MSSFWSIVMWFFIKNLTWQSTRNSKNIIITSTFGNRYEHARGLFQRLDLLDYEKLNKFYCNMFVFKSFNDLNKYQNKYHTSQYFHERNLRHENDLRPPRVLSTQSQKSVLYRGCILWNDLPIEIRNMNTISFFKGKLRELLLNI